LHDVRSWVCRHCPRCQAEHKRDHRVRLDTRCAAQAERVFLVTAKNCRDAVLTTSCTWPCGSNWA
jgi:hypothetical protein